MKRRGRSLRPEEKELWETIAARTDKVNHKRDIEPAAETPPKPAPDPRPLPMPMPVPAFRIGQKVDPRRQHDLSRPVTEALHTAPLMMDHKKHAQLKRGKLAPEARIDLHGMTLTEAHTELHYFIMGAHDDGKRLVLVITGKGKDRDEGGPIPTRLGVLRHQVPMWLRLPPLGPLVQQVVPAHIRHGGHGAYYVYLSRHR